MWCGPSISRSRQACSATSRSGCRSIGIADAWSRIVVEKPFGRDLASAKALNEVLAKHFNETQIYRIDHYLGKETVQNLMAVRFANILFEPLWKAEYIDHVQITVAETVGVDGRGAYYDKSGAMRDMVQNHLMQLLCLIAMEPPYHFDPDAVRDEKLKVIRALKPVRPEDIVRGQYGAGKGEKSYVVHSENPASQDRKLYRAEGAGLELALAGGAVLSAHRQKAAGAGVRNRDHLQAAAACDL
jgi:glucose-6-phosphate 1-dehydrogenase